MNQEKLQQQWPDTLLLLQGAFRSGLNMEEALSIMVSEAPEPLRSELLKRWTHSHKWMPMSRLIDHLLFGHDLELVRAALHLAHEKGAEQSRILETCARILREKSEFKEKVRTLSAQGRMTAWVVGLSPLFILGSFQAVSPDMVRPLYQTQTGWFLLGAVGILAGVGVWVVHRMARIEP